jgi:hypothetical protein
MRQAWLGVALAFEQLVLGQGLQTFQQMDFPIAKDHPKLSMVLVLQQLCYRLQIDQQYWHLQLMLVAKTRMDL